MSKIKVLGVVGMSGSGKSAVADYLADQGWPKIYMGGMILQEMHNAGVDITPENEERFRVETREREGGEFMARRVSEEVRRLLDAGQKQIVIDGLYSWAEYRVLKREFPTNFHVLAVVVDKNVRHHRVAGRAVRAFDAEEINRRDISEIEELQKGGPIAMADYYVMNDGSLADLHRRVDEVVRGL